MAFKSIRNLNLNGKKILVRVDLNSSFHKGKILESDRIKEHAKTINFLLSKKAKVVILAHQGSPGNRDCVSLEQHAKLLSKYAKVKFIPETIGKKAWFAISSLKTGKAILLQNVRYLKSEFEPSTNNDLVNFMKEVGIDYYVNDAFSVSHRNQTSIVSFPKVFPSAIGLVFEEELKNAEKIKSKLKHCLFILGGAKSKDLLPLLKHKVLTGGRLSIVALKAKGFNIKKENGLSNEDSKLIPQIKKHLNNMELPVDLAISIKGKRKEIYLDDLPSKNPVYDIGRETIEIYKEEIKKAKAIFFKGAPGLFQYPAFSLGTREILKAIAGSKAFSVIAGGQSSDAIKQFNINPKKFDFISLSGGALVKFIAGEKLVGLEVLKV